MPQIVGLPAASLPVDGTEIMPIVQGGITSQIALSDAITPLTGSVTSVGMSVPTDIMTVAGSPITSSGTLAVTLDTQDANTVFCGPTDGSADEPTFRHLIPSDITDSAGFVRRTRSPAITVLGGSAGYHMEYVAALDKLFFTSNTSGGKLFYMDRTTDTAVLVGTYAAKTPAAWCYSAVNGHLYIAYGANIMEVNASTGAIINAGIAMTAASGMAIRPSTGLIYSGQTTTSEIRSLDPSTNTVSGILVTMADGPISVGPFSTIYCADNDSIYILNSNGNVTRFDIAAVTQTVITCHGVTGGGGAIVMGSDGLIYVVSLGAQTLKTIDPSADVVADTYTFPPGYNASGAGGGSLTAIDFGDYVYIGTQQTTPGIVLCFHKSTAAFVPSLTGDGNGFAGRMMGGLASESVLYCGRGVVSANANSYVVFGR